MKTNPNQLAIAYYRVSSEGQRDNTSLKNQKNQVHNYANSHNLKIVAEFEDVASGGNVNRSGFQEAMTYLEDNPVNVFIVFKYDRAHRNLKETLNFVDALKEKDVGYISVTQKIDTTTPQGRLFFQMVCSFDEFERETIKERCREGRRAKIAKKESPGGTVPLGYDDQWNIVEKEAEVVKKLFLSYLRRGSLSRLVKYVEEEELEEIVNMKLSKPTLTCLLKNRAYLGEYRYDGKNEKHGVVWENDHEPIISPSLFGRVQSALKANQRGFSRNFVK